MKTASQVEEARTDQEWWKEQAYYNSEPSPDPEVRQWFERRLPKRGDWSAIEIGACPGGHLLTLACSHGYHPVALDFLPAVQRLPATFRKHGIGNLEVIQDDFLSLPEDRRFNVVMSFGFIEHFNNTEAVLRKHWALVEDDGYLIVTLPIFGPMQLALLRLVLTPEKLAEQLQGHNTSIMDMRLFRKWSKGLPGAEVLECGYMEYMGTWLFSSDPFVRKNRRWILWLW
jgi:2-polyprenyl-3-methyl-5-hydroxy-6-metoxy-1,4-benzoquinol methylase